MKESIVDLVDSQVIPAVTDNKYLDTAIASPSKIVFLLTGDLLTTKGYIQKIQESGKIVFLHLDLIDGVSNGKSVIKFIATEWKPDGIITTKHQFIKEAHDYDMRTIQRIFMIDHGAMDRGEHLARSCKPDAIEILPGIAPRLIDEMAQRTNVPIIAGGLIDYEEEIHHALQAGALAASVSKSSLWDIGI